MSIRHLRKRTSGYGWALAFLILFIVIETMSQTLFSTREPRPEPDAVVSLWTTPAGPSDAGEVVTDQGRDGHHDRHIMRVTNPRLRVFLPEHPDSKGPACIICPGGGYYLLAADKEGDDVAHFFCKNGIAAFVLIYRLPDGADLAVGQIPVPVQDVQRAMRMVRADAARWKIDPDRIGIMGFSAGGHLASTVATQFDSGDLADADPIERQSCRPDFAALIYPVITMRDPVAHAGSRQLLLGKSPAGEVIERYSSELHMTPRTPPLFLAHAEDDTGVSPRNSLIAAEAALAVGVPCELVLVKAGGHGFGLGLVEGDSSIWPARLIDWMRGRKLLSSF